MKQNKRRTATVVYIFIFMLTVSGCVRKGKEQGKNRVSIKGVTYEGILKVCDEDKFKELLVTGIGRGKAYGMGLLTIVHV